MKVYEFLVVWKAQAEFWNFDFRGQGICAQNSSFEVVQARSAAFPLALFYLIFLSPTLFHICNTSQSLILFRFLRSLSFSPHLSSFVPQGTSAWSGAAAFCCRKCVQTSPHFFLFSQFFIRLFCINFREELNEQRAQIGREKRKIQISTEFATNRQNLGKHLGWQNKNFQLYKLSAEKSGRNSVIKKFFENQIKSTRINVQC